MTVLDIVPFSFNLEVKEAFISTMDLFLGLGDGWGMKPALTRRPEILKELGSHLLQTLDGFIFVLSADGKIM